MGKSACRRNLAWASSWMRVWWRNTGSDKFREKPTPEPGLVSNDQAPARTAPKSREPSPPAWFVGDGSAILGGGCVTPVEADAVVVNVQEINRLVRDLRAGLGPLYIQL